MVSSTAVIPAAPWGDIDTKGFVVCKGFLSPAETAALAAEYAAADAMPTTTYQIRIVGGPVIKEVYRTRVEPVIEHLRATTAQQPNLFFRASYFATEGGINFPWHVDHETFYLCQTHQHHLNFWMPIQKEDPKRSNLSIVPYDRLGERAPELAAKLKNRGAHRLVPKGEITLVLDDEEGTEDVLDLNIDEIAYTPELDAGDLLLVRADVIHRTQDAETRRIAVSLRAVDGDGVVKRALLEHRCPMKEYFMKNGPAPYDKTLELLRRTGREDISLRELVPYLVEQRVLL